VEYGHYARLQRRLSSLLGAHTLGYKDIHSIGQGPLYCPRLDLTNEQCDDVHVVDRNASATQPAKFLVVLTKDKGAPALLPAQ
jgi:hypothetical protein